MASFRKLTVHRRVLVNLLSGRAVSGVVVRSHGTVIEMRDARGFEPGVEGSLQLDGVVVIERSKIDFVQIVDE